MPMRRFLIATSLISASAGAECRLCAPSDTPTPRAPARPLAIEVRTALDLGRAGDTGTGGSIAIDGLSGARQVHGLADLGGMAIKGSVRLTGEPFRQVRIALPWLVLLTAPDGSRAEARDLRTDLPPQAMLDATGQLVFSFGGRLFVTGGTSGDFRGRFQIVADYF